MDLKKIFVYVPTGYETAFKSAYDANPTAYENKIAFLQDTKRIFVRGNYYGSDPADIQAIYTLLGGDTIAALKTKLGVTSEAADFATAIKDAIAAAVNALDVNEQTIASVVDNVITLKTGISETDGKIAVGAGSIALEEVAYTGAAADVSVTYAGFTTKTVEGALIQLDGADKDIIAAYVAADSTLQSNIDTAYANAEAYTDEKVSAEQTRAEGAEGTLQTNINTAYANAEAYTDEKVSAEQTRALAAEASARTAVEVSGSGISVDKTTAADGHDIYTITADQSIWEFLGTASATTSTVASVLNAKYGEGEGQIHREKEAGDVWAVTLTDHTPNDTVLYAYDGTNWVVIGSAQGVTGIDTTASYGVALTNTANVVGVAVTPGSIADGNDSVVTGGAVFTAISNEHDLAYAKIAAEKAAIVNAYTAADTAIVNAYTAADTAIVNAYTAADTAIVNAYTAADTTLQGNIDAVNTRIDNLDAAYGGTLVASYGGQNYTYLTYGVAQNEGLINTAYVTMDANAIQNYVLDTMWETFVTA